MLLPIVVISFLALFVSLIAVSLWINQVRESPRAEVKKRLRRLAGDRHSDLPDDIRKDLLKEMPQMDELVARFAALRSVDRLIDHAGVKMSIPRFLTITGLLLVAGVVLGVVLKKGVFPILLLPPLLGAMPFLSLRYLKAKRLAKFTEQFPDALLMMSRSLRAGHSLTSAVQVIAQEMSDPVAGLFRAVYDQQALGLRLRDSLSTLSDRMDSLDLRFFITTVNINTDIGGNLAELLDKLSETIRKRLQIRRQVQVYTAQARLSGYVLACLPVVAFLLFNILLPGYEKPMLETTRGHYMLGIALIAQAMGFLIIRKIIDIRI